VRATLDGLFVDCHDYWNDRSWLMLTLETSL
jgi:hypothetical protein